jgi:hypothetical protein
MSPCVLPLQGGASPAIRAPQLASSLLEAGRCLLALAVQASSRAAKVGALLEQQLAAPAAAVQQQIQAAQQQVQAVGDTMLRDVTAVPAVAAALAASAALAAAQQAVSLEALCAAAALRLQEGPAVPAPVDAAAAGVAALAVDGPAKDGKKDKKKDKKGGAGVALGKGSAIVRSYVESAAAGAAAGSTAFLQPAADKSSIEGDLAAAFAAVAAAVAPQSAAVARLLADVKAVVEANQARRKPKVPKGARDFLPEQMSIREQAFSKITAVGGWMTGLWCGVWRGLQVGCMRWQSTGGAWAAVTSSAERLFCAGTSCAPACQRP